ncbi:MAG TPA: hypothetical protein PK493_08900, partial [Pseudomonadota bacterium]|nr:hypothetical protein [Pseudomonadota bacterium]
AQMFDDPPPPSGVAEQGGLKRPQIDWAKMDAVVARAMHKEPAQRYPDCAALLQDLRAATTNLRSTEYLPTLQRPLMTLLTDAPVISTLRTLAPPQRRYALFALAGAVVFGALALAWHVRAGQDGRPTMDMAKQEPLRFAQERIATASRGETAEKRDLMLAIAAGHSRSQQVLVVSALADPQPAVFRAALQVANRAYHLALMLKIYQREICCYDTTRVIDDDNLPSIQSQVTYLQLGPASIITNPGELLPELLIGGYGGEFAGKYTFIDKTKPNAPDVSRAPKPPYLIDVMDGDAKLRMTFGLTHDFVGYIVPRYNFVLDEKKPYLDEAAGDHYEETNSVGPLADPQIVGTMRQLVLDGRKNESH